MYQSLGVTKNVLTRLQYNIMYYKFINYIERQFGIDAHYFVSNSFWVAMTQVVTLGGSLLVTVLFAHLLSEELFGNYRYLIAIASIISVFSLNSIGQSILQTAAQGKLGFFKTGMRYSLASGILSALLGIIAGIYYFINDNPLLASSCFLIAIVQPIISSYFNVFSLLSGQQRFQESAILQTVRVLAITVVSVGTILVTQNVFLLFLSYQIMQLTTNGLGYWYFKPKAAAPELPPEETKKYLHFAFHQSVQAAILNTAQRLDAIVVFQHLGATQLAFYSIALVIPDQIRGFIKNLSNLLFPKYVTYTPQQLRNSIPKRSIQLFFVLLTLSGLYIVIAPYLFALIFPKYITAILYSQILALAIPASIYYIIQSALKSETNSTALYYIQLSSATVRIILTLVLTYTFGIIGTITAFVASSYLELSFYFLWFYFDRK